MFVLTDILCVRGGGLFPVPFALKMGLNGHRSQNKFEKNAWVNHQIPREMYPFDHFIRPSQPRLYLVIDITIITYK